MPWFSRADRARHAAQTAGQPDCPGRETPARPFARLLIKKSASRSDSSPAEPRATLTFGGRGRLAAIAMLSVVSAAAISFLAAHMQSFTVLDGEDRYVVSTLSTDPADAVQVAGLSMGEYDEVRCIGGSNEVAIDRSFVVHVTVDGVTTAVRMTDGTVGDALEQMGVNLAGYRLINAQLTDSASDGLDICVESVVSYAERTENQTLAYETEIQYTDTLPKGEEKVVQAGQNGSLTRVWRDTMVDGEVSATVLLSEDRTEPVNEIRQVGTYVAPRSAVLSTAPGGLTLDANGQPLEYQRVLTGTCTAYTSDRGLAGTRTSTGRTASVGVVAVDPSVIPYGTELYIVSADGSYVYGYAVAGDTGGAMLSGHALCDLFMNTYEECIAFGRRQMNVYILG